MRSQEEIVREIVKVIKKERPTAAVDETYIRDEIDRLRNARSQVQLSQAKCELCQGRDQVDR